MKVKRYKETHMDGTILLEGSALSYRQTPQMIQGDFGIEIAEDGRIWICVNGVSFLRFSPTGKYVAVEAKLTGGDGDGI